MKKHDRKGNILLYASALLDDITASAVWGVFTILLVFTLWTVNDLSDFNSHGAESAAGYDLEELSRINPDTAAWLKMDDTHIDYPVVRGRDNFEYLDLDINRQFYVGGTLFLDASCKKDLSDPYILIHGHHMSDGLMFGDLDRYLDKSFMTVKRKGVLRTIRDEYELEVFAAGTADAYDSRIYNVEMDLETHLKAVKKLKLDMYNADAAADKVLVLSTCTERMDNTRTVVFCSMKKKIRNKVPQEVGDE